MQYQYNGSTPTIYRDKRVLPGETVTLLHPSDEQRLDLEQWAQVAPAEERAAKKKPPEGLAPPEADGIKPPSIKDESIWTSPPHRGMGSSDAVVSSEMETGDLAVDDAEAIDEDTGANATPRALALAEEHGLDLADVQGTGAGGRILVKDVERLIGVAPPLKREARPWALRYKT